VTPQAGLTALVLMPVLLVGISLVLQPVLIPRYTIPAAFAFGPALAYMLRCVSWPWLIVAGVLFWGVGGVEVNRFATMSRKDDQRTDEVIKAIREQTGNEPVLFESPSKLYVVCRYAPELAGRCFLLDFEEGQIGYAPRSRVFVRDLSRKYNEFYALPHAEKWENVRKLKHFYIVPTFFVGGETNSLHRGPYPGFYVRRLGKELYDVVPDRGQRDAPGANIPALDGESPTSPAEPTR
jgi:hypothetical protein